MFKSIISLIALAFIAVIAIKSIEIHPPSAPFVYKSLSVSPESVAVSPGGLITLTSKHPNINIKKVKVSEERATFIQLVVEYEFYPGENLQKVFLGGSALYMGLSASEIGFRPALLQPGEHTAVVDLVVTQSSTKEVIRTDSLNLHAYPSGGSAVFDLSFNFIKNWCRERVSLYNAYLYCNKPSAAPKTELFIGAELLHSKPSQKTAKKANQVNAPPSPSPRSTSKTATNEVILSSRGELSEAFNDDALRTYNGTFDSGLQGWALDKGAQYATDDGIESSGALRMAAKAYIPESVGSWREANASLCLPATGLDSVSITASMKFDELPHYQSSHHMGLTWFSAENCRGGGQHGGYAYPDQKMGWQTLTLANSRASLGAKSFKFNIIQNQTKGQKEGVDINEFLEKYRGKTQGVPDPVSAVWDDIDIKYELTPIEGGIPNHAEAQNKKVNLLKNPSFDKTNSAWRGIPKDHWKSSAGGRQSVMESRLVSENAGLGTGAFSQCIELDSTEGRIFETGIDYQNVPGYFRGGGRLRVIWHGGPKCTGKHQTAHDHDDILPDSTDWVPLVIYQLVRPPQALSVTMELIHSIDDKGERRIWWDNAYFHAVK